MSVDFYPCDNCGEVFCDCGEYVKCEDCGKHWCCTECADEDGFKIEQDDEESYRTSCKYCRGEEFTDEELLDYALKLLDLNREELVAKKNKEQRRII